MQKLYDALEGGCAEDAEKMIGSQLRTTISYFDCYEGFYHGFLLGLLKGNGEWMIRSNREAGMGRSDIQIEREDGTIGMVIEVKHAANARQLQQACAEALRHARARNYAEPLVDGGVETIWSYGIAFSEKKCCLMAERVQ